MFVLAFNNTTVDVANNAINNTNNGVGRYSHKKYFLPRLNITDYNVFTMAEIFMINLLNIKSKNMIKLGKMQQDK